MNMDTPLVKISNTQEYIGVLTDIIACGNAVSVLACGVSMYPFLRNRRDTIHIGKADLSKLKRGDIVLFRRKNGQYVIHRIYSKDKKENQFYLIGDFQSVKEGPVEAEQIKGIVVLAKRNEKIIQPGNIVWEFYEHIWLALVPVRRFIISAAVKMFGLSVE